MILETLQKELLALEGVSKHTHRFGGIEFRYRSKELGHIHGEKLADLPFPKKIHNELVQSKFAQAHHIYPESGWMSFYIKNEGDIPALLKLFYMQYERLSQTE